MSDGLTLLKVTLKQAGQSDTSARRLVFSALEQQPPQTMKQLTDTVSPAIDRASVYRIIRLFEEIGVVHRVSMGWKYKLELSDRFAPHHHHLSCLACDKVIDINDEEHINEFIRMVSAQVGFEPRQHQFEVEGYCRECQQNQARD